MAGCIVSTEKLGFPYKCADPFLFCVYHRDVYPPSTQKLKRGNGADFDWSQPYRMYHGTELPGFPQHPHRGFETVTATLEGTIDHADSLGNAGRYGGGDLQWMTAGAGVVHGEMFPIIHADRNNTCRFFQIWLNLEKKNKMAPPSYVMHWNEDIPRVRSADGLATITVWAGEVESLCGLPPPLFSYGAQDSNEVAILHIALLPGGSVVLPPASRGTNRRLYWVEGTALSVGALSVPDKCAMTLDPQVPAEVRNPTPNPNTDPNPAGSTGTITELLLLQGRPIGEPVVQHGPFVMNTDAEIQQAFADYRRTQFGGWPWPQDAMSFPVDKPRFTLQGGKEDFPPPPRGPAV